MSGDYGLLDVVAAIDRAAALLESGTPAVHNHGLIKARAVFLRHLSGVQRGWVPKPSETEDDIL